MYKSINVSSLNNQSGGLLNPFKNMSWSTIAIIVFVIIILVGCSIYYYRIFMSRSKTSYKPNLEGSTESYNGRNAELMLFYVDWCPHCKTAKPEWEEVKQQYEGKTINGYTIVFTEFNCTEESPEIENLMNKYKIEGYPTIKLLKDGQIIEFDAKPTRETLNQFLNSVL